MTKPKLAILAATAAISVGVASCGGDDEGPGAAADAMTDATDGGDSVTIKTFMYEPDPLEVDAGTTVTFTNEDNILHTVTEGTKEKPVKGGFDLKLDGPGTSGELTLDEPGTIQYTCTIHQGMDGSMVVR